MIKEHLSDKKLKQLLDNSKNIEQFKRYQVIYLRKTQPKLTVNTVAQICSVASRTVTQWTYYYNKFGAEKYILKGRGGRRNFHLSWEEEAQLLASLNLESENGNIITALKIKKAAEKIIGKKLSKDYAYDLMHRHNWRKIMPHSHHPKTSSEKKKISRKTSQNCWIPPESN